MNPKQILLPLFLLLLFIAPTLLHAQADFIDDTADVPIDGGISLLVAAGVGYGAKKLRANKIKNQCDKSSF